MQIKCPACGWSLTTNPKCENCKTVSVGATISLIMDMVRGTNGVMQQSKTKNMTKGGKE